MYVQHVHACSTQKNKNNLSILFESGECFHRSLKFYHLDCNLLNSNKVSIIGKS